MIYNPREDSFLLERYVKRCSKGKKVLDVGTGSGIQAISAKEAGAKKVVACDINPEAVKIVNEKGIETFRSDLFSNIWDKFDLIIFNPPYLPEDEREDEESKLVTTGGKKGDEIIVKFIKQSKEHLNKKGKILLLISSLTPQKDLIDLINKLGWAYRVLGEDKFDFETLQVWIIESD
jgi:release factor glutamine methyltransferase